MTPGIGNIPAIQTNLDLTRILSHRHSVRKEFVQVKPIDVKSDRWSLWPAHSSEVYWFCTLVAEHCVHGVLLLSCPPHPVMEYGSVRADPKAQSLASLTRLCLLLQLTCTRRLKISL